VYTAGVALLGEISVLDLAPNDGTNPELAFSYAGNIPCKAMEFK
jgi:hypothetical protein